MAGRHGVSWDSASFARLKQMTRDVSASAKGVRHDPTFATPMPREIGLQLTNRCNLRCKHCFQWNEDGAYHRLEPHEQQAELDIELIERILSEVGTSASRLYLWGGEPLVYGQWDRLIACLQTHDLWTVLCTNGIGLSKKLESLCRVSHNLTCLVSIDGFQPEHDALRGRNTFKKTVSGISSLLDAKAAGHYRGEVSVSAVIHPALTERLIEFVAFFEGLGVNTVYLGFPWYIPTATARRMDAYFSENFGWLAALQPELDPRGLASWHSYTFRLHPECIDTLVSQMGVIAARTWNCRVRFQPELTPAEVPDFILGSEKPGMGRSRCLSVVQRLNVLPNGDVTTCKLFPEFAIGNLQQATVAELWHSAAARRARQTLSCGLTPVCSKCVQLYLAGV